MLARRVKIVSHSSWGQAQYSNIFVPWLVIMITLFEGKKKFSRGPWAQTEIDKKIPVYCTMNLTWLSTGMVIFTGCLLRFGGGLGKSVTWEGLGFTTSSNSSSSVITLESVEWGAGKPGRPKWKSSRFTVVKQVAQWATISHHGASKMFGDTIIYDAQRQITLNLKQWPGINSKT